MDRGAWWATVCGVARVGLDLATEQQLLLEGLCKDEKKPDEGRRRCCQHVWDFQPLWYPHFSLELGEHMEAPPGVCPLPRLLSAVGPSSAWGSWGRGTGGWGKVQMRGHTLTASWAGSKAVRQPPTETALPHLLIHSELLLCLR